MVSSSKNEYSTHSDLNVNGRIVISTETIETFFVIIEEFLIFILLVLHLRSCNKFNCHMIKKKMHFFSFVIRLNSCILNAIKQNKNSISHKHNFFQY